MKNIPDNFYKPTISTLSTESIEDIIPLDPVSLPVVIDLSDVLSIRPWGFVGLALILYSLVDNGIQPKIIFPKKDNVSGYMQRMHFDRLLVNLGLEVPENLKQDFKEQTLKGRLLELCHIETRADFYSKFEKDIKEGFKKTGLSEDTSLFLFSIIAEIVDNTFFHNVGQWPLSNHSGGFVCMQNFPKLRILNIALGDTGQGVRNSFINTDYYDTMKDDETTLDKVLGGGYTSRPQKRGGLGLKFIRESTLGHFQGELDIRSGVCHKKITKAGSQTVFNKKPLLGTLVQLSINY